MNGTGKPQRVGSDYTESEQRYGIRHDHQRQQHPEPEAVS